MTPAWCCLQLAAPIALSQPTLVLSLFTLPPSVVMPISISPPLALDLPVLPILMSPHSLPFPWKVVPMEAPDYLSAQSSMWRAPHLSPQPPSHPPVPTVGVPYVHSLHGGRRQPMCDPEGCATVLGAVAPPPPPWLTQTLGVGGSGGQPPGSPGEGGSVGTPTYIPQNDPRDTLIILNMRKWGKKIFKKKLPINSGSHQPRSDPGGRVGVKIFFCAFQLFLNSPQNSQYFEYRHIGSNKKLSPCRMPKTKSPAPLAPTKPIVLYNHFGVCRGGGGVNPPPLGSGPDQDRPP